MHAKAEKLLMSAVDLALDVLGVALALLLAVPFVLILISPFL